MFKDPEPFFAKLEKAGEEVARTALAQGRYARDKIPLVEEWLRRKDAERGAAAAERVGLREDKRVSLAQEANDIAKSAVKTARIACGISGLAVIVAIGSALIAVLAYIAKH